MTTPSNLRVSVGSFAKLNEKQQLDACKALPNHLAYWKTKETELEFIPHPSTWLNQERWEDEIVIEPKKQKESREVKKTNTAS